MRLLRRRIGTVAWEGQFLRFLASFEGDPRNSLKNQKMFPAAWPLIDTKEPVFIRANPILGGPSGAIYFQNRVDSNGFVHGLL